MLRRFEVMLRVQVVLSLACMHPHQQHTTIMRQVPRCYRAVSVTKLPVIGRSPRYFDRSLRPKRCGISPVRIINLGGRGLERLSPPMRSCRHTILTPFLSRLNEYGRHKRQCGSGEANTHSFEHDTE